MADGNSFNNPTFSTEPQGQGIPMNQYPVTKQPQPLGQQHRQFPQNGGPPPPYFQQQEQQHVVNVIFREADLITGPLQNLDKYYIRKTGQSTRAATDTSNRQLFTYSEQVIAATQHAMYARMFIVDNNGTQFLTVDVDLSGTKVNSGNMQLGVFDQMGLSVVACRQPLFGNSTVGLGQLQFKPKGLAGICCCSCFSSGGFDIMLNNQQIGEISLSGNYLVEFQAQLDPRLKGLIIIGSFLLFNVFG